MNRPSHIWSAGWVHRGQVESHWEKHYKNWGREWFLEAFYWSCEIEMIDGTTWAELHERI